MPLPVGPCQVIESNGWTVRKIEPGNEEWFREHWPSVASMLSTKDEWWRELYTVEHFFVRIVAGKFQLWVLEGDGEIKGAMVTHVTTWPTGLKTSHVDAMAGEGWLAVLPEMRVTSDWGREQGISLAYMGGRPGWERALRSSGYEDKRVFLRKRIDR